MGYRALNKVAAPEWYPLPLIKEMAPASTKFDIWTAFHRLRVAKGDERLTAFTRFELFEWLTGLFGPAGAPAKSPGGHSGGLRDCLP